MKQTDTSADGLWMAEAIALARRGEGLTRPNPPVGALVVRDGRVVGKGYHKRAGRAHAEVLALRDAGASARGATLYVSLEPCSTTGRTPPCTHAILENGVGRVVAGTRDPNPSHAGRGLRVLQEAGVDVHSGVMRSEADALIAPFKRWVLDGRPFVTLKLAESVDGRIADSAGRSRWLSGTPARRHVQALRRRVDAVVVGVRTAVQDDPRLLPRPAKGRKPYRCVVDARGAVPRTHRLFNDSNVSQTVIATSSLCSSRKAAAFERAGADVRRLPHRRGRIVIPRLLAMLAELGCLHMLCEGGGELAASLIRAGVVDEYQFIMTPRVLGGGGIPAVGGAGWPMASAPRLRFVEVSVLGEDVLVRAVPRD